MSSKRWLADWRDSEGKPVFYHCINRIVERRFALGDEEKEKFRMMMRMCERFGRRCSSKTVSQENSIPEKK